MSASYLPGQASYLAVLRPFELGEDPSPRPGAAFPRWLASDGSLAITLPAAPLTPAMETRIGELRRNRLRWAANNHLLHLDGEEAQSMLASCPPCSRPLDRYAPFCKQRLCPFCYGREHVEYFYRNVAALAELLWSEGKSVYVALDAAQVLSRPDGSLPAWKAAEDRSLLGNDVDNQPRGLIEMCQPRPYCTAGDRRSFEGGVRVFCPLPAALSGASRTQPRPVLNVRWLRVHSAQPSPMALPSAAPTGAWPHLVREIERLSDLVPLVAATCEFPVWMLDPRADDAEVAGILTWSQGHQFRASYGSLVPKSLGNRLFDRLDRSAEARFSAMKSAFLSRYDDTPGRPLTSVHQVIERLAFEHGVPVLPGRKRSRRSRKPQETTRAALRRALPGWPGTAPGSSGPAFPEMGEEVESARVFRGPDGQLYVVMPAHPAAPLDTLP